MNTHPNPCAEAHPVTIDQIKHALRDIIDRADKSDPLPWQEGFGLVPGMSGPQYNVATAQEPNRAIFLVARVSECTDKDYANAAFIITARSVAPRMAKVLLAQIEALELAAVYNGREYPENRAAFQLEFIRSLWEGGQQ